MPDCACGHSRPYPDCCGRFIEGSEAPKTPEELMRSRYTAFTQGNVPYVMKTMTDTALDDFDPVDFKRWINTVKWTGLTVVEAPPVSEEDFFGSVEFVAGYERSDGETFEIHEKSDFEKIGEEWYYVSGETPKIEPHIREVHVGRNDPCLCGSGKKYKKCCGA